MSYYFNIILEELTFNEAVTFLTEELRKEGFGVVSEINMKSTFEKKLDLDFREYKIIGSCSPTYAYRALNTEDKIGLLLPCNFVVQQHRIGEIEISAVNPMVTMTSVDNEDLNLIANQIQRKIKHVLKALKHGNFHAH